MQNPQIIHSAFGERIPTLERLCVTQILLGGYEVRLGLQRKGLPEPSPSRWRERNYDMLEFRFSFSHVVDLSIVGTPPEVGYIFSLELEKGAARLLSSDTDFSFALKFRLVQLDLHPLNARIANDLPDRFRSS